VGRGLYVWAKLPETPALKLEAARLRLPASAAFSGKTAAWLHGLDVEPCDPIETIPHLDDREAVLRRGFRTASIVHVLFDLSRRLSLVEAVVIADLALHAGLVDRSELSHWIDLHKGRQGVRAARRVLELAEGRAESPMETRLRMLLVLNGLPRPEAQVTIRDEGGIFVGRPDLFYREHKLGLEYDGEFHRTSLVEDNRRQNRLLSAGIRLLRFSASDVLRHPHGVLAQVRDVLIKR
jgi:very-short-patch-repair endonuclease